MENKKRNVLFICSDQHNKHITGCYGNEHVLTPNIDRLADQGVCFDNAYSSNPICVPARAGMATGCYSFQTRTWDNASPYTGQAQSFGSQLEKHGIPVTTIGKLHYRNAEDDTGFKDQRIPLHIRDGVGDLFGTIREYGIVKHVMRQEIPKAHAGDSSYVAYDRKITEVAVNYLEEKQEDSDPWCLYVGYTFPHLPFICPEETWNLYDEDRLPMPHHYKKEEWMEHESCRDIRDFFGLQEEYEEQDVKRAVHAYYGMCTFLDNQIGELLKCMKETGLLENTYIIYSSDHGEMLGNHGLWFKNNMLEDSAGIPMILCGPDIPKGRRREENVSLIDIYPTILDMFRVTPEPDGFKRDGISLYRLARGEEAPDRAVFSEFHASASYTDGFMVRYRDYKYIYYVGYPPQLFNIKEDPQESADLALNPEYREIKQLMDKKLREIGDPEAIHEACKRDQEQRLTEHGGREEIKKNFVPIIFSPPPEV